jgi:hypothetical protein
MTVRKRVYRVEGDDHPAVAVETGVGVTQPNKWLLAVLSVAHVVVTALVWRDISRQPAGRVRGSKRFWRVFTALNMGNSVVYLVVGRRRPRVANPTC